MRAPDSGLFFAPSGGATPPAVDEARLDALLLELLRGGDAVADVFVETATRRSCSATITRDGAVVHVPVDRRDGGLALRLVTPPALRSGHVSRLAGDEPERLARFLAGAAPPRRRGGRPVAPPRDVPALSPRGEGDALAGAAQAAVRLLGSEPRLATIVVDVTSFERFTHVVSSETGHARERRAWQVAAVTVGACGAGPSAAGGPVQASARRGRGAPPALSAVLLADALSSLIDEAARAVLERLDARPVPAGSPGVVLAAGAGGVLVHEAVGHALEADVVQRGASVFSGRRGERIAVPGLTVLDDPTLPGLAGSYGHDDEGRQPRRAVLIEDGVLRGSLCDGLRADFHAERATGHGRRASHREPVLPRMANTYVEPGAADPREIVEGLADGLLVTRLERAAVDPMSGDFSFRVTEGWRIEGGRLTHPAADHFLRGNATDVLQAIDAIGSDLAWDDGRGTCGREGQWLPVAVGQPTLRVAPGVLRVG